MAENGAVAIRLRPGTSKLVLDKLRERLARVEDLRPLNEVLAKYMVVSTRRRFSSKQAPDGTPWAPLTPATEALRARAEIAFRVRSALAGRVSLVADRHLRMGFLPGDALVETGALKKSIRIGYVGSKEFEIRSDSEYANAQQKGVDRTGGFIPGKSIPARPFLGFSEENLKVIARKIRAYVDKGST